MQGILQAVGGALQNFADAAAPPMNMQFKETYRCFPVAMCEKESLHQLEKGDKIVLPASALDKLARLHVAYPMLFQIENIELQLKNHCGVMEFSAREGHCYIPHWVMENLALNAGDMVTVANVSLPKGTFVQLQPHKSEFVEQSNPKAILEIALRQFTCLTKGTTIVIPHQVYDHFKLDIVDVKPGDAISIVETDVNVDFLPPKDADTRPAATSSSSRQASSGGSAAAASSSASSGSDRASFGAWDQPSGSGDEEKVEAEKADSSPSGSYFAKLGKGHSLGSNSGPSQAKVQQRSSTSSALSKSHVPPDITGSAPSAVKKRVVEESNGFRYIYEVDPKTQKKRLVRRVPIPKTSYFQGKGHKLSKRKHRR